jgi:hypothetical protein
MKFVRQNLFELAEMIDALMEMQMGESSAGDEDENSQTDLGESEERRPTSSGVPTEELRPSRLSNPVE